METKSKTPGKRLSCTAAPAHPAAGTESEPPTLSLGETATNRTMG